MADDPDIFLSPEDTLAVWREREPLRTTVAWSEMVHEAHATAFTAAKIAQLDLLTTLRQSLDEALAGGRTFEAWQQDLIPSLRAAGWWGVVTDPAITGTTEPVIINERRLRTIYNTNLRMTVAAGRWRRAQAEKHLFPYVQYLSDHPRKSPRLDHLGWHGLVLPVDDPAWLWMWPPNGWGCKCRVIQLTQATVELNDLKIGPSPNPAWHPVTTASGRTIMVPDEVDPGFAYNPGDAHLRAVHERLQASAQKAREAGLADLVAQILASIADEPAFAYLLARLGLADEIAPGL